MEWEEIIQRSEDSFWGLLGGRVLSVSPSKVEAALTAQPKHLNSVGIVHGGVLSSLMDQVMGFAVIAAKGGLQGVTTHLNVNFLAPLGVGELIITAYPVHETHRTMTLHAEIRNAKGELGCMATGTFRLPRSTPKKQPEA
ncbi:MULTISPECIES: PaaI family thioesterase [Paenibacillus]|uniref:PaaI family thioesterase n=1 Tax=Paenibacillus TaxID=44249 RepID=UPI00083848C3|nr:MULTISPECIES: PaaI family thioesterase [Paenibacillus]GIP21516.1 phenylacetic acid degradation protein PaaD [Paenibacillus sp. J22TS3]